MDKQIVFVRHGKLDLPYSSHDEMPKETLNDLATGKLNPQSDQKFFTEHRGIFDELFKAFDFTHVSLSPSNRCRSLKSFLESEIPNLPRVQTIHENLQEVYFDLDELFPKRSEVALEEVTPRLLKEIVDGGSGAEPIESISSRYNFFLDEIESHSCTLVLTHGYFMRAIAALVSADENELKVSDLEDAPRFGYFDYMFFDENGKFTFIHHSL